MPESFKGADAPLSLDMSWNYITILSSSGAKQAKLAKDAGMFQSDRARKIWTIPLARFTAEAMDWDIGLFYNEADDTPDGHYEFTTVENGAYDSYVYTMRKIAPCWYFFELSFSRECGYVLNFEQAEEARARLDQEVEKDLYKREYSREKMEEKFRVLKHEFLQAVNLFAASRYEVLRLQQQTLKNTLDLEGIDLVDVNASYAASQVEGERNIRFCLAKRASLDIGIVYAKRDDLAVGIHTISKGKTVTIEKIAPCWYYYQDEILSEVELYHRYGLPPLKKHAETWWELQAPQ